MAHQTSILLLVLSALLLSWWPPASGFVLPPSQTIQTQKQLITKSSKSYNKDSIPYSEAEYNPQAAKEFYRSRNSEKFRRLVQIASLSGGFITNLLFDKLFKREENPKIVEQRSQQLLEVVTKLGPAFIKVGQALSIRTDLLPAPYVAGLVKLQDAVPPFSATLGRSIIQEELRLKSLSDAFSDFSPEPVASASIGQVYKASLRNSNNTQVAIKVQRPNVLYNVALDLFLMREILVPLYLKFNKGVNTDLIGLVDAWGVGFVNELDYQREANATTEFSTAMAQRGLGSVMAPSVLSELSSMHVLTTEWVDGERLEKSRAADVPRLCGVALNAYLTMLLDTGTLHCDPHPGNLLRTKDGRLCILDFGMCLQVPPELQLSLLEFIANLQAENYEQIPDDLVNLRFVPKDKIDDLRASGMTYGIAQMLQIAGQGGGPKGAMEALVAENKAKYKAADGSDLPTKERQRRFREDWAKEMAKDALAREMTKPNNVTASVQSTTVQVTQKIEQLQQQNANVFAIPEYFVYMSRAFATLEGIGLSVDPKYAILSECFPYLAKRLLSDDSPRARGALRTLLYGTNTERGGGELNLAKLREITDGLESYTTSTASAESSLGLNKDGKNAAAEQLATVILSEEDNYVQSLLLREVAVMLDAAARESVTSFAKRFPITLPPPPPKSIAPLLSPITLPLDLARAALQLQQTDDIDAKRLENVRILSDLVNKAGGGVYSQREGTSTNDTESNRVDVARIFREAAARRNALARIGVRFGSQLASTQAEHLRRRQRSIVNSKERELSELAERLAIEGANSWERIASALEQVDRDRSMAKEQSPRKR